MIMYILNLPSCDSVRTAASERVLYFSSCPNCRDSPSVLGHTASQSSSVTGQTLQSWEQKAQGCVSTMPKEKCLKGSCSASDYRKSFLCAPSTSKKYLVKCLQEHCHLPHLQHKSNYFPVNQKSAVYATQPESSNIKS